jgi:hypothetical protein
MNIDPTSGLICFVCILILIFTSIVLYFNNVSTSKEMAAKLQDMVSQYATTQNDHKVLTFEQRDSTSESSAQLEKVQSRVKKFDEDVKYPNPSFQSIDFGDGHQLSLERLQGGRNENWLFTSDPHKPFYGGMVMGKTYVNNGAVVSNIGLTNKYSGGPQWKDMAEIANDNDNNNELILAGNRAESSTRKVNMYDNVNIYNNLNVDKYIDIKGNTVMKNSLDVKKSVDITGKPVSTQLWFNANGQPQWINISNKPKTVQPQQGPRGDPGASIKTATIETINGQIVLVLSFTNPNISNIKLPIKNIQNLTIKEISLSDRQLTMIYSDGSRRTMDITTIVSSDFNNYIIGLPQPIAKGEMKIPMRTGGFTAFNTNGKTILNGVETVVDNPFQANNGLRLSSGQLCINNTCVNETTLRELIK